MDDTYDAIMALKASIDKQNELQEDANHRVEALTEMLGHLITELQETRRERVAEANDGRR